ncbi:hypothetical protein PENSPDRAFT_559868, partial [Peniophora sp. CONT]
GLFSAMVAAFVIESYKTLSPDPSSATTLILAQISRQLANADGTLPADSQLQDGVSSLPDTGGVRVNALWMASLCISVSCALFAVMVQQWARRFQRLCDRRPEEGRSSEALARVHMHLHHVAPQVGNFIELLQRFLHVAVVLCFAGLVEFFSPINGAVARIAKAVFLLLGSTYVALTVLSAI